jgi:type 1 fimbria pilin
VAISLLVSSGALAQAGYTAQVRGTVTDQTYAIVQNAKLTMTNDSMAISSSANTDSNGQYVFNGLFSSANRMTHSREWRATLSD